MAEVLTGLLRRVVPQALGDATRPARGRPRMPDRSLLGAIAVPPRRVTVILILIAYDPWDRTVGLGR